MVVAIPIAVANGNRALFWAAVIIAIAGNLVVAALDLSQRRHRAQGLRTSAVRVQESRAPS